MEINHPFECARIEHYALGLETPPAARSRRDATFGAGAWAERIILDASALENGHFQPPKGAVGVSLKRLRRTTTCVNIKKQKLVAQMAMQTPHERW